MGEQPQRLVSWPHDGVAGHTATPDRVSPTALRFRSMLLQTPCLISAIALYDEELLFQNELSVAFCADTGSYLDVLFSLQPESTKQVRDRIRLYGQLDKTP